MAYICFLKKIKTLRLICLDVFQENVLCLLGYLEIIVDILLCVPIKVEGGYSQIQRKTPV